MAETSPARLLLIEDEPGLVMTLSDRLSAEGYEVQAATDGETGLTRAATEPFEIIVLDGMLPRRDGFDVCRTLRQRGIPTPILMLTARGQVVDRVVGLKLGADDYLTKPFAFAELLVRVKALLRRGPVNRSSTLRIGDLELDRLTQQVKRHGKRIELTAKEYSLLEYLMQNPDRVLSRNMIIEHVWDQSFDGITNIVDVYVRHLRSKIDEGTDHKMIRTVRGTGYMIRSENAA